MDRLTLRIENRSDAAGDMPEDISVLGQGITIGRKVDNDWCLPDTTRFISGRHVRVLYEEGSYLLEDMSTNGTFLNGDTTRIEGKRALAHGDTIRIGSFIITVEIEAVEEPAPPKISGAQGVQAPPMAGTIRPPTSTIQRHTTASTSARSAQTPDFSRFQSGGTSASGVQRPTGGVSQPPAMGVKPAAAIPDDFDDDLMDLMGPQSGSTPEPAPESEPAPQVEVPSAPEAPQIPASPSDGPFGGGAPAASPPPEAPAPPDETPAFQVTPVPQSGPAPEPRIEAQAPPAPAPAPSSDGPFSMSDPTAAPAHVPAPVHEPKAMPVVEKTDMTPRGLGERFAETTPPRSEQVVRAASATPDRPQAPAPEPAPVAAVPTPAPTPAPPATNALLEGFIEGAGIDDPDTLNVPLRELGIMLGKCARLGTQEMMQMLQDRSAVKLFVAQEDRTMRIASGNNPMKFMLDPDEAFKALFVEPRDGYQTGPDGFDNALSDIRQHQAAMMAAIQPALADMLEGLAPKDIAEDAGGGGGMLGSGARKSWEEYTKRWEARAAQGENGMLDAFLDAFSRRYNQALDTM